MPLRYFVVFCFGFLYILEDLTSSAGVTDQFDWQYWLGRQILSSHHIPRALGAETFSANGAPWVPQEWLFSLLTAVSTDHGWQLVFRVLIGLCPLIALLGVATRLRRRGIGDFTSAVIIAFAGLGMDRAFGVRPALISYAALSYLFVFFEDRRFRWCAVPLTILWANFHASATLAPLVVAIFAVAAVVDEPRSVTDVREHLLLTAACAAATLCTPLGIDLIRYSFSLNASNIHEYVTEWSPPRFSDLEFLCGAVPLTLIAATFGIDRRERGRNILTFAFFLYLMFSAVRHVPLFTIACGPLIAFPLQNALWRLRNATEGLRKYERVLVPFAAAFALIVVRHYGVKHSVPDEAARPLKAAAALIGTGVPHNVFCFHVEQCNLFLGSPVRVFADGRGDPYPAGVLRAIQQIGATRPDWYATLKRKQIDSVVAPPGAGITGELLFRGWQPLYRDSYTVVLVSPRTGALTLR